jgi:PAS domain S-box-containing protein
MAFIKNFLVGIKIFFKSLGTLEQAQIVASTAVIITMITIITVRIASGEALSAIDFISVLTVGVFGYVSIFFALRYGRVLEAQRQEVFELNTMAEAVNYSVDLNYVLQSALIRIMQLMHTEYGWIYVSENDILILKHMHGSSIKIVPDNSNVYDSALSWLRNAGVFQGSDENILNTLSPEFQAEPMKVIITIPLNRQGIFAGLIVLGSNDPYTSRSMKLGMLQAYGNQISMALNNAYLFDQVKKSEELYADLYENSPDMYHSVDRNGIVVSCNRTESQVLGIPKEMIIGNPLVNLYPPQFQEKVIKNLSKIFEEKQELKGYEEQIRKADGTLIDVSVNTSIVYDIKGTPSLVRMVLRDITEKKKMEAKILQAQKIDSIGNLAGGIAHDFNNILTAILGSASIMRRRINDDSRLLKYVDLIETTSRRGAAVTRQLLTFARKGNPQIVRTDINLIIDQTIKLFEVTTPKTIHIKMELSEEPLIVEGDEGQLQQALLNLCLNARDSMPKEGIIIIKSKAVVLREDDARRLTDGKPGEYVMVSVIDSGYGISPEIMQNIFEPFFTTKEHGKGTGLGLAVVYGVVKSHNGHVHVVSEVNSGSVFTLYFPRLKEDKSTKSVKDKKSELVGGNERVLIVEDEISVGEIGADILHELGYEIVIAHNGREALDILQSAKKKYDLVILDMNMPRMSGGPTFEAIKKDHPSLKVLVCSGYSAGTIQDDKFMKLIDGFLQKPFELDEYAQTVRKILDIKRDGQRNGSATCKL